MPVFQENITLKTQELKITDLTEQVRKIVARSKIDKGLVNIFNVGSTASIATIEYEPGLLQDFPALMQKLIPQGVPYAHDRAWEDANGHSHLRATMLGASVSVPLSGGELLSGTWQQIVHVEYDHRPRTRTVVVTVTGE